MRTTGSLRGVFETITVDLGERSYPVLVGHGVRTELAAVLPDGARRAVIITQDNIGWSADPGIDHEVFSIPNGEDAKSLGVVESLCRRMARAGITRSDVVIAIGGGVVTDVGGFVAAVYHRGVRFVSVATTLLGQVDAAIGGKTGVNLAEGKNLVGAFWQPLAVLCDTETLSTLPGPEFQSGLGEVAKYHFLGGGKLDALDLNARVAACVTIKAGVVSADEREGGLRATLNYGHTLAHAIETAGRHDLRHGEAVAVGIAYAAEVALRLGRIDDTRVAEHRRVLATYDLPCRLPPDFSDDEILALFSRDKKALDDVTLVLDGPAGIETVVGVPRSVLIDSLGAIR